MKDRVNIILIGIILIVITAIIVQGNRYDLINNSKGYAFRIDRVTGEVWLISGRSMEIVKEE